MKLYEGTKQLYTKIMEIKIYKFSLVFHIVRENISCRQSCNITVIVYLYAVQHNGLIYEVQSNLYGVRCNVYGIHCNLYMECM